MSDIQATYKYKITDFNGRYLGLLPNVISEFELYNEINTAGVSLNIVVELTGDTASNLVEPLQTEAGDTLTTEALDVLTTESAPEAVGNYNQKGMIRNNNLIEVVECSALHPNGVTVFRGYISKWTATFGKEDNIKITCLGYGSGLDNTIIQAAATVDVSQTSQDATFVLGGYGSGAPIGQTFIPSVGTIDRIVLMLKATVPTTVNVSLYLTAEDAAADIFSSGSPLGSVNVLVTNTTAQEVNFPFDEAIATTPGASYFMAVKEPTNSGAVTLYYKASNVYANGVMYVGTGISPFSYVATPIGSIATASDIYFKTYAQSTATNTTFTAQDPSNIVKSIIDAYNAQGGEITYTSDSIDLTGLSITYTFSINTVLEGIRKMLSLAPANWYWYVDPGTNILYFKEINTTPDHYFIKKRHIQSLDLEATIENLKNIGYFTGGDTGGGSNLYYKGTNADSLAENRVGIARLTDNRVTVPETAEAILEAYLDENSTETYITSAEILASDYDVSTIDLGEIAAFRNFGVAFVEKLLLQIVGIRKYSNKVVLSLGVLPKRQTLKLESIQRALLEVQTVDNPGTPS